MGHFDKYTDKAADKFDELYHKGLKGAIRKHPLTYFFAGIGGGAALGFVVGLIL